MYFINIPIDIVIVIISFLNSNNVIKLIQVCKNTQIYKNNLKHKVIIDNYHTILINIFGLDNLKSYPILLWNNRFLGNTNYIDKINYNDMKSPIMIGKDRFNRYFICLKLRRKIENSISQ